MARRPGCAPTVFACLLPRDNASAGRQGPEAGPRTSGCAGLYFTQPVPPFRLLSPLQIEHCHAECVTDTQVCGARFCDPEGNSFAVTGYDLSEIFRYSRA